MNLHGQTDFKAVKALMDKNVLLFETPRFIEDDPISIPHKFSRKEDIEIAGLLTAVIAWGNRKSILKNAHILLKLLENEPYNFTMKASPAKIKTLEAFYHRTFNGTDSVSMLKALRSIYRKDGMEKLFAPEFAGEPLISRMSRFRKALTANMPDRTKKHIADMEKGSAAKRLNMFLRWMVRSPEKGVDFGLWKTVSPAELYLPLDVHSGRIARQLGLTERKQNDRKTVEEVTAKLRLFCPEDPAKYDFALFAAGAALSKKGARSG